jgi:hypothetical protein
VPISDLLWACPLCGLHSGLRDDRADATCTGCAAVFRRSAGATIVARTAAGREEERPAAAWLAALPDLVLDDPHAPIAPQRAVVRVARVAVPLRFRRRFIGFGERFGARMTGTIALTGDALVFEPDDGEPLHWPLDRITAVQPTSSALQIKARGLPVAAIRFLEASVRFWEFQLQERLRARFRAEGRGEIVEFQPRICTR